MMSGTNNR